MTQPSVTEIRSLSVDDAHAVFTLLESARAESPVSVGPKWTLEQLEAECREFGLVFERNGGLAAFVLWRETGAAWEISFLATDPAAQGQGLMTALLEHLKSIRSKDRPIWLEVHELNRPARRLYEKAGFIKTGERPRYYSDGGTAILYNYG